MELHTYRKINKPVINHTIEHVHPVRKYKNVVICAAFFEPLRFNQSNRLVFHCQANKTCQKLFDGTSALC